MTPKISAEMIAAGHALDVAAAAQIIGLKPRPFYLNDAGQKATPQDYVLAGLHSMRVANSAVFSVAEGLASRQWLLGNGWNVPA